MKIALQQHISWLRSNRNICLSLNVFGYSVAFPSQFLVLTSETDWKQLLLCMPVGETFQYLKHLSFVFDMDTAQVVGVEGKGRMLKCKLCTCALLLVSCLLSR